MGVNMYKLLKNIFIFTLLSFVAQNSFASELHNLVLAIQADEACTVPTNVKLEASQKKADLYAASVSKLNVQKAFEKNNFVKALKMLKNAGILTAGLGTMYSFLHFYNKGAINLEQLPKLVSFVNKNGIQKLENSIIAALGLFYTSLSKMNAKPLSTTVDNTFDATSYDLELTEPETLYPEDALLWEKLAEQEQVTSNFESQESLEELLSNVKFEDHVDSPDAAYPEESLKTDDLLVHDLDESAHEAESSLPTLSDYNLDNETDVEYAEDNLFAQQLSKEEQSSDNFDNEDSSNEELLKKVNFDD